MNRRGLIFVIGAVTLIIYAMLSGGYELVNSWLSGILASLGMA